MDKNTDGWIIVIRRDDGMGINTWFDDEDEAIAYENEIWRRGYLDGETYPENPSEKQFGRYPIAKCRTTRFRCSFEGYAQGRDIDSTNPPFTTTYNWQDYEKYIESEEASNG